jgi:glycosyltransferase involved in cell wall biosynthesis
MNRDIKPLVSVITPCFNDGKFLNIPIDSISRQTYNNIEHIIIDDGSSDPYTLSKLCALELCQNNKLIVLRQGNMGLPAARNAAIKKSSGNLILPLDADDKISDDAIELMVNEFIKGEMIDVVYSNFQNFGNSNRFMKTGVFNTYRILFSNYMPVCSMFKKVAWEKVGGYTEEMKGFEDWEFWIKLVEIGSIFKKIDATLYYHHIHNGNMWLRDKGKFKILKKQIISLHPNLYTSENIRHQKKINRITIIEDLIYKMPTNYRYELRKLIPNKLILIMNKIRLYRD